MDADSEPGPGYVNQDPDISSRKFSVEDCQTPNCGAKIICGTGGQEPEGIGCDICRQCGSLVPWADQGI